MKKSFAILATGLLVITACATTNNSPSPSPQPIVTEVRVFPTPSSPGDALIWNALQVTVVELEITPQYVTDFGSTRIPSDGNQFLWVHVHLENIGAVEMNIPLLENFSILYAATELKPSYGHRAEYSDYTALDSVIFPAQELDGWLRFEIPNAAQLSDLRFVFLPTSAQVGASYNSPNYPYADNKPTYVWNCDL